MIPLNQHSEMRLRIHVPSGRATRWKVQQNTEREASVSYNLTPNSAHPISDHEKGFFVVEKHNRFLNGQTVSDDFQCLI